MTFFKLTADMAKEIRGIRLTAAEWRVWSYLVTLDPFGDRYVDAPDILTIMTECGVSKSAIYRAISKFQEHELFDFQAHIRFRNLKAEKSASNQRIFSLEKIVPDLGKDSQNWESSPRTGNLFPDLGLSAAETTVYQASGSPQTKQTFLDPTDNWAVDGKKGLEEEEVDQAIGAVDKSPLLEDLQEDASTTPLEVPSTPIADRPTKMAETPVEQAIQLVSASNFSSLPTQNKVQPVEAIDVKVDQTSGNESLDSDEVIDGCEQASKPSEAEVAEVLQQLRGMGFSLNLTVRQTVKEYFNRVGNAIAHIKERQSQGEKIGCVEALFVKACKEGWKPEKSVGGGVVSEEINPISPDQLRLLDEAKAAGKIHDHYFSGIQKTHCVVLLGGFVHKPWIEYLGG